MVDHNKGIQKKLIYSLLLFIAFITFAIILYVLIDKGGIMEDFLISFFLMFGTFAAALAAWHAAEQIKKGVMGQIILTLSRDYASEEMYDAHNTIYGEFGKYETNGEFMNQL